MYYFDSTYLILIPALILAAVCQIWLQGVFRKYSQVRSRSGLSGADMARQLLASEGVTNVPVERVGGQLSDHYDPRSMTLRLSESTYDSASVAALGVAAHEAGHVLQHRDGYAPLMLRNVAAPTVSIGSTLSWPLFVLGLIVSYEPLLYVGIGLFSLSVIFALLTLPVEFNASHRALEQLTSKGYLQSDEIVGAKKVLTAAAMTYVASALTAILQLLRLLALAGRRRD